MSPEASVVRPLAGWGRFPIETCRLYRPEKRATLPAIFASGEEGSYIARGLGRSYGDAALNASAGVIDFTRLDRMLGFDPETAILECEAGVSLAAILEAFLPRGFFLPVTPGTRFVTVGGAIAHDVHGKNHHRVGTFSRFVLDFRLLTPVGEMLLCSPTENPEVFRATVGGAGLTGLIVSARIRLLPVESAFVRVDYRKAANLDEALAALGETDHLYEYSVAWIDGLAGGASLGRSVLMQANHALRGDLPARAGDPLALRQKGKGSVPFDLPAAVLNRVTVGAFNAAFYRWHPDGPGHLVDFASFFYPLDAISHWNRLYGKRGFVQYQLLFPPGASRAGLTEILQRSSASGRGSFLGVLKRFGAAGEGMLSFPFAGYTLALDLPAQNGLVPFLRELDRVVLDHGGRLYLAKDAAMTPATFAAMYPEADRFRQVQRRLDPRRLISSSLARRVGLLPV